MHRTKAWFIFLTFIALLTATGCQEVESDSTSEILAVMKAAEAGWNRGDLEAYMQCYQNSPELRFAGKDEVSYGWEPVLEKYRAGYADQAAMGRLLFSDLDVTLIDRDNAMVFGRWQLRRAEDEPHGLFTLIMKRQAGQWKIVHDHTSSGDPERTGAEATITSGDLLGRVALLSGSEFGGRLPGSPGYRQAARAMADRFAELGLQPGGEDGYFQHLPLEYNQVLPGCRLALELPDQQALEYTLDDDYIFRGFTGSGQVKAPVVFCGYGLSFPDRGYDDYAGVDVTGQVVLVFKQGPPWSLEDGSWNGMSNPRPKAQTALHHGALAVLMVSRPNDKNPQPLIGSVMHGGGDVQVDIPQVQISSEVAADLLGKSGLNLAELQTQIDESKAPSSHQLGQSIEIKVDTEYLPVADTVNVVGILPGSDPELKDEYLLLGAHLDHVGTQGGTAHFAGANDNASGTAAVVEMAEAFVQGGVHPRPSVVFVLFTGEEQGLVGSKYYAAHPARPLAETVAMFNLDCVAHGDSIQIWGGHTSPVLWDLARGLDVQADRLLSARTGRGGGADAAPFHQQGVPTIYFTSKYSYTHLHRTSDTVETLNGSLYESLTRLAYRTAAAVADGQYQREELTQ